MAISKPEEKGLWIDVLCLMFFSPVRGALLNPDGTKMDNKTLGKLVRMDEKVINKTLNNLITNKVARVLDDGTVVSWRMYRKDKDLSQKRREAGFKGMKERWGDVNDNKQGNKVVEAPITNDNKHNLTEKKKNIDNEIEEVKEKEVKIKYLEFVYLTEKEHKKLIDTFGQSKTEEYIRRLNDYIGSKGKKYKSHYHTILVWNDMKKGTVPKPNGDY